jgi:hypothetical protein
LGASKKKILLTIVSIFVLLLGVVFMVGGAIIMYLNSTNDAQGYALSNTYHVQTDSNAYVLWVGAPVSEAQLKWSITATQGKEVFAGWGDSSTIKTFADNYQYATPIGWNYRARAYEASLNMTNVEVFNTNKPIMPTPPNIWLDSVTTSSTATLHCSPKAFANDNTGMLVIMNTDNSKGVDAQIQLGSKIPSLSWLPYALLPLGLVLLITGVFMFKKVRKTANTAN